MTYSLETDWTDQPSLDWSISLVVLLQKHFSDNTCTPTSKLAFEDILRVYLIGV